MTVELRRVEYYDVVIEGHAGEGSELLSLFADVGVNLLAFKAVPLEPMGTRFSLFPDDGSKMMDGAKKQGIDIDGPYSALLVQGDDESGALAVIYEKLSRAGIDVMESNGIADIQGSYGVVIYLEQDDYEKAVAVLEM